MESLPRPNRREENFANAKAKTLIQTDSNLWGRFWREDRSSGLCRKADGYRRSVPVYRKICARHRVEAMGTLIAIARGDISTVRFGCSPLTDHSFSMTSAKCIKSFCRTARFGANEMIRRDLSRTLLQGLLAALNSAPNEKLTSFALRLALTDHLGIPQEGQPDLLAEAEASFNPSQPISSQKKRAGKPKKTPSPILATKKAVAKKRKAA